MNKGALIEVHEQDSSICSTRMREQYLQYKNERAVFAAQE
jgi:hypothetical protein